MIKQFVMLLLLLIGSATLSMAQGRGPKGTSEERADKQLAQLTKELGLSAQQQPQVRAALLSRIQKADAIRAEEGKNRGKFKEAKEAIDAYNATMKTILTPEQYTTLEAQQQERKEKVKEKRKDKRNNSNG
jgi:periplasmic protein CpxP/Spy